MPKILVISWAMPPMVFPRSLQISRLLNDLNRRNWKSTVLSVDPISLSRGITIDLELERHYEGIYEEIKIPSREQSIFNRVLFKVFPLMSTFPDDKRSWAFNTIKKAQSLLTQHKFDLMISFAQPWSSHLVCEKLHTTTKIPWIAHFSDPWTNSPYQHRSHISQSYANKLEERVINLADHLIFVTEETKDLTLRRFPPTTQSKATVISHGYDTSLLSHMKNGTNKVTQKLTLVHTGQFYGIRNAHSFFEALGELKNIMPLENNLKVIFVGQKPEGIQEKINQLNLASIIELTGPKSYMDSLRHMNSADVLILIEAPSKLSNLFLPSKLADYMMFKKPILGLVPLKGTSASILKKLDCPFVAPDDVKGITAAVSKLITLKSNNQLGVSKIFEEAITPFDIKHCASQFETVFKNVLGL